LMGALQKPQLQVVRTGATAAPRPPEAAPPSAGAAGAKRDIGDFRLRPDLFGVIDAELPEGAKLQEDSVTVGDDFIQFYRIVSGTQYLALLYFDEGYQEVKFKSWFVAAVCLRLFTTTNRLKLDTPAIEILAARSRLLPFEWQDELAACVK